MNKKPIYTFVDLLEQQEAGNPTAVERIAELDFSIDHGYCLYNLYEEWRSAFSFSPGREEALQPIIKLARKLQSTTFITDDTIKMYRDEAWKQLVELRSPGECVVRYACVECNTEYDNIITSGFGDITCQVCPGCGNVFIKSIYDDSDSPLCSCGKSYFPDAGCPSCGSTSQEVIHEISPYQYFKDHKYTYDA